MLEAHSMWNTQHTKWFTMPVNRLECSLLLKESVHCREDRLGEYDKFLVKRIWWGDALVECRCTVLYKWRPYYTLGKMGENLLSKYTEEKFQYLISLGSLNFSKHCQKWDGKTNLVASLLSTKIQSPTVLITQLRT